MRPGSLHQGLLDVCKESKKRFAYVTVVGVSYIAPETGIERFNVKERYCVDNEDAKDSISDIPDHSVTPLSIQVFFDFFFFVFRLPTPHACF